MCVAEFTDLSGYQVSLVFLDFHGTDILLAQREKRKERAQWAFCSFVNDQWIPEDMKDADGTSSFFSFLFLLRGWLSGSCEGALSSFAYSLIKTSIDPFTPWSLRRFSSSRASSSSSTVSVPLASCRLRKETYIYIYVLESQSKQNRNIHSIFAQLGNISPCLHLSSWPSTHPAGPWSLHPPWPTTFYRLRATHAEVWGLATWTQAPYTHRTQKLAKAKKKTKKKLMVT